MVLPKYDTASLAEIERLKKLVKKIDIEGVSKESAGPPLLYPNSLSPNSPTSQRPKSNFYNETQTLRQKINEQVSKVGPLFEGGIAKVEITREPIKCDNPVLWMKILMPNFRLYRWQFETLMQFAGYLTPGKYKPEDKSQITDADPLLFIGPMANGSGKDMVLIAGAVTWFVVTKPRNRAVVTTSSFEQMKTQTEPHIRELCHLANRQFGPIFKSTQFHHIVPELGGEIKLFATDEAGKAEGFHPFHGGDMMIVINEAKTVTEAISDALLRCTGYSHRIEISSPGPRSGFMFSHVEGSVRYPEKVQLGRYYFRRVTAFDCPHIPQSHIDRVKYEKGEDSPWYKSSILGEFSDVDAAVLISEYEYDQCMLNPPNSKGDDIGIGLDLAAGGDEDACFIRKGNKVIHQFFFRQQDTDLAALIINRQLEPWKRESNYAFRADNGGVGMGIIDKLVSFGWRIRRTNNQSPAFNKREFLNLGAEQWSHLKRLIARRDIILPNVDKLKTQVISRWFKSFDTTQGKTALESKQEARASGRPSPDRADAFVLCFASYHPNPPQKAIEDERFKKDLVSANEILKLAANGTLFKPKTSHPAGRFTLLTGKI